MKQSTGTGVLGSKHGQSQIGGGYRMSFKYGKLGRRIWSIALIATLLFAANALAQVQDGNLVGSILDTTGAAIPNAKVEAENIATGVKVTAMTGADGYYRLNSLLPGTYRVKGS